MVGALLAGGLTSVAFLALLRSMQIMAAAGEIEIARRAFLFMGMLSLLFAALFVVRQPDYKRLLAYSSVEHMGILAIGIGIGGIAVFGAMLHMVNNALVKGVLFLAAGNINRRFASKRREEVSGVIGILPVTAMLFIAAFLAVTPDGRWAAGSLRPGFQAALRTDSRDTLLPPQIVLLGDE